MRYSFHVYDGDAYLRGDRSSKTPGGSALRALFSIYSFLCIRASQTVNTSLTDTNIHVVALVHTF